MIDLINLIEFIRIITRVLLLNSLNFSVKLLDSEANDRRFFLRVCDLTLDLLDVFIESRGNQPADSEEIIANRHITGNQQRHDDHRRHKVEADKNNRRDNSREHAGTFEKIVLFFYEQILFPVLQSPESLFQLIAPAALKLYVA